MPILAAMMTQEYKANCVRLGQAMSLVTTREVQLAFGRDNVAHAAACRRRGDTAGHAYWLRCAAERRIYASQCMRAKDSRCLVNSLHNQMHARPA